MLSNIESIPSNEPPPLLPYLPLEIHNSRKVIENIFTTIKYRPPVKHVELPAAAERILKGFLPPEIVAPLSKDEFDAITLMKHMSPFYEDNIAYLSRLNLFQSLKNNASLEPDEFKKGRENTTSLIKYVYTASTYAEKEVTYFLNLNPQVSSLNDLNYGVSLLKKVELAEDLLGQSARGALAHLRIKVGKLLHLIKVMLRSLVKRKLLKKVGFAKYLSDNGVKISKESRAKWMRISTIKGVENWEFLGVDRLDSINRIIKSFNIKGTDQIQILHDQYSLLVNMDCTDKMFNRYLECLDFKRKLKGANVSFEEKLVDDLLDVSFPFGSSDLRRLIDVSEGQDNINEKLNELHSNKGKWSPRDILNDDVSREKSINSLTITLHEQLEKQLTVNSTDPHFNFEDLTALKILITDIENKYTENPFV